jgi:hypothetical protein
VVDRLLRNSGLRQNVGDALLQIVLGLCTAKTRTKERKCDTSVNNRAREWFSSGGCAYRVDQGQLGCGEPLWRRLGKREFEVIGLCSRGQTWEWIS